MTFNENDIVRDSAGRFDEKPQSAPEVSLGANPGCARCDRAVTGEDGLCDTHTKRWGELTVQVGSRTPWGEADTVEAIAPGMVFAGTPGHGGVKLTRERNALIPPALRNSSGWYEEDCEVNIPARYFPDEFAAQPHYKGTKTSEQMRDEAEASIKTWFPDKWEKANGRVLAPGESLIKDEQTWAKAHAADPISTSAIGAESDPDMVVVTAAVGGYHSTERDEYLVPKGEYNTRSKGEPGQSGRFVVDPARHPKLPPLEKTAPPPLIPVDVERVSREGLRAVRDTLTPTALDRIARDLGQRWRDENGNVREFRDILMAGATSKTAYQEGTSTKYAILVDRNSYRVSKATWDYISELADDRSPALIAQQKASAAEARLDGKWNVTREERQKVAAMHEEAARLRKQEADEREAREGTWQERDARRRAAQAERERAATVQA